MTIYVVEIGGRGIAAFNVNSASAADDLVRDLAFRDDLMVLRSTGVPLWNGREDILVRPARPAEDAKWQRSRARALRHGDVADEAETWIGFLVAIADPDVPLRSRR